MSVQLAISILAILIYSLKIVFPVVHLVFMQIQQLKLVNFALLVDAKFATLSNYVSNVIVLIYIYILIKCIALLLTAQLVIIRVLVEEYKNVQHVLIKPAKHVIYLIEIFVQVVCIINILKIINAKTHAQQIIITALEVMSVFCALLFTLIAIHVQNYNVIHVKLVSIMLVPQKNVFLVVHQDFFLKMLQ